MDPLFAAQSWQGGACRLSCIPPAEWRNARHRAPLRHRAVSPAHPLAPSGRCITSQGLRAPTPRPTLRGLDGRQPHRGWIAIERLPPSRTHSTEGHLIALDPRPAIRWLDAAAEPSAAPLDPIEQGRFRAAALKLARRLNARSLTATAARNAESCLEGGKKGCVQRLHRGGSRRAIANRHALTPTNMKCSLDFY